MADTPKSSRAFSGLNILTSGLDGFMRGMGLNSHLSFNAGMLAGNNNPRTPSPTETRDESPLDRVYVDGVGREDTSTYRDAVKVVRDAERIAPTDQVEAIRRLDSGFIKLATYVQGEFTKIRTTVKDHATNINKLYDQNLQLQRRQRALDDQIKFLTSQQRPGGKDNSEIENLKRRLSDLERQKSVVPPPSSGGGLPDVSTPWWRRSSGSGVKPSTTGPASSASRWGRLGSFGRGIAKGGIAGITIGVGASMLGYNEIENPLEGDDKITQAAIEKYGIEIVTAARQKYGSWYTPKNPMMQANRNDLIWSERYVRDLSQTSIEPRIPQWQRPVGPSAQSMDRKTFNQWLQQSQTGVAPGSGFSSSFGSRLGNSFTSGAGQISANRFGDNRTFRPFSGGGGGGFSGGGGSNATGGRPSGGGGSNATGGRVGSGGQGHAGQTEPSWIQHMRQGDTATGGQTLLEQRTKFAKELENPELKNRIMTIMAAEVGGVGNERMKGQAAVFESMINRASSQGASSLNTSAYSGSAYYQPFVDGGYNRAAAEMARNPALRKQLEDAFDQVMKGSDYSKLATQNSSAGVASSANRTQTITNVIAGETFSNKDKDAYSGTHGVGHTRNVQRWLEATRAAQANEKPKDLEAILKQKNVPAVPWTKLTTTSLMNALKNENATNVGGSGRSMILGPSASAGSVPGRPNMNGQNLTELFKSGNERLFHQGGQVAGVDAGLLQLLKHASKDLPDGYRVEMISGRDARSTGTTNHPSGLAVDTIIYDDKGREVPHNRGGPGMSIYEKMYLSVHERGKIEQPGKEYIWGGTWISRAAGHGDPMHIQLKAPIRGTSQGSGAYSPDAGAPGHEFQPWLMSNKERMEYRQKIRDQIKIERTGGNTATSTTPTSKTTSTTGAQTVSTTATAVKKQYSDRMPGSEDTAFGYTDQPSNLSIFGRQKIGSNIIPIEKADPYYQNFMRKEANDGLGTGASAIGDKMIVYDMERLKKDNQNFAGMMHHEITHIGAYSASQLSVAGYDTEKLFPEVKNLGGDFEELRNRIADEQAYATNKVGKSGLGLHTGSDAYYVKSLADKLAKKANTTPAAIIARAKAYNEHLNEKILHHPDFKKPGAPNSATAIDKSSPLSSGTKGNRDILPVNRTGEGVVRKVEGGPDPVVKPATGGAVSGKATVYNPEMTTTRIPGSGVAVSETRPTPGIGSRRTGRPDMRNFSDATDVTQPTSGQASLVTEHIPGKVSSGDGDEGEKGEKKEGGGEGEGGGKKEGGEGEGRETANKSGGGGGSSGGGRRKSGGGGSDDNDNGGYGSVNTGGNNSTDFGPSPGSDGYGGGKDSPDNNGGICAI